MEINISLCRICLINTGKLPIFEKNQDSTISNLIVSIANLRIIDNVDLPKSICMQCMSNINVSIKLKQNIINSERILKGYLKGSSYIPECVTIKNEAETEIFYNDNSSPVTISEESRSLNEYIPERLIKKKTKILTKNRQKVYNLPEFNKCKECDKKFKTAENLAQHMRIHLGQKPFECNICGKQFTKRGSYNIHQRKHTNERPYICEICSKQFMSSGNLQQHMLTHETQRKFHCNDCNKTFCHEKGLKAHIVLHSGMKSHVCLVCDKAFPIKSYLTRHTKTVHHQEKRFKCSECEKAFSNSGNLQAHIRIHTGEKPYECTYCDSKFNQSTPLVRHMQQHKKNKDKLKNQNETTHPFDIY